MAKICGVCNTEVYHAEQVSFHGRYWHSLCFKCSNESCGKALAAGTALENNGNPYCNRCHMTLFGAKGFNSSFQNTGVSPVGEAQRASIDMRSNKTDFFDPLKAKAGPRDKATGATQTLSPNKDEMNDAQIAAERNRQALRAAEVSMEDEPWDPDAEEGVDIDAPKFVPGSKGKGYVAKQTNLGGGNECPKCRKPVGFADKLGFVGTSYHKECFTCSGTCKKQLFSAADALEHNGNPYCKHCFPSTKTIGFIR